MTRRDLEPQPTASGWYDSAHLRSIARVTRQLARTLGDTPGKFDALRLARSYEARARHLEGQREERAA